MKKYMLVLFLLMLPLFSFSASAQQDHSSNRVVTRVGSPAVVDSGWPTTGRITQGPRGPAGHGDKGLNALDISNVSGTPIYATFEGLARAYDCTNRGECSNARGRLGNWVMLLPDEHPGAEVLFGHLLAVEIQDNTRVQPGDLIGYMGTTGYSTGVHLHYEFRGIPMAPPYIPEAIVPVTCGVCTPQNISTN